MKPEYLQYIYIFWTMATLGMIIWSELKWPPKSTCEKYSFWTIRKIRFPFGRDRFRGVDKDDVVLFESYKKRMRIFWLYLVISTVLIFCIRSAFLNYLDANYRR
jgi:hypothetical protein